MCLYGYLQELGISAVLMPLDWIRRKIRNNNNSVWQAKYTQGTNDSNQQQNFIQIRIRRQEKRGKATRKSSNRIVRKENKNQTKTTTITNRDATKVRIAKLKTRNHAKNVTVDCVVISFFYYFLIQQLSRLEVLWWIACWSCSCAHTVRLLICWRAQKNTSNNKYYKL